MGIDMAGRRIRPRRLALAFFAAWSCSTAYAQSASAVVPGDAPESGGNGSTPPAAAKGAWPKYGLETIGSLEFARARMDDGTHRGPDAKLRLDSTFLVEFSNKLSLDGLFQFKPRQPLATDDPNKELYTNQGPGRREGGKFKELYVRYGEYRIGKFVQDFGRAYLLLPGGQAADFTEESERGYEPSEMVGIEKIHVLEDESNGWRQISVSAFMADKTVLHRSFPYDEGRIHLHDGGIGNTRLPENFMATWDVLRQPLGNWAHLDYQASVIRWGKTSGAERGEFWSTVGGNLNIPVRSSVEDTLGGRFGMVRLYLEAARRDNFSGTAGRARDYVSAATSYISGPWQANLTTTQRWTTDRILPLQRDRLWTTSLAYSMASRTMVALSVGRESVAGQRGSYIGLRITQAFTACSKCTATERY